MPKFEATNVIGNRAKHREYCGNFNIVIQILEEQFSLS